MSILEKILQFITFAVFFFLINTKLHFQYEKILLKEYLRNRTCRHELKF